MHRYCFAVFLGCLLAACLSASESAPSVSFPPADFATDEANHDKRAGEYIIAESDWPDYGVPGDVNHFPSYQERSIGLWINVARIGYLWYRDSYLQAITPDGSWTAIFDGSGETDNDKYSSVAPGFWNFNLNRAARAHCIDVRSNDTYFGGGGGHNDTNGTSASVRIHRFSSCYNAEVYINQAPEQGLYSALTSVGSWMCDGFHGLSSTPRLSKCSRDNGLHIDGSQGQNGHRRGIMKRATQFGCGVDGGAQSSGSTTTTCDFCSSSTTKYSAKHLAAGSHVGDVNNTNPKKFLYMATVLTTGITVSSVKVIEQTPGATNTITLSKMYQGTSGAIYGSPSYEYLESCRTYYFQLTYGSTTERYPESGFFYTYGMNCNDDWKLQGLTSQCTSGVCCDTANQVFKPATTICRESVGGCDIAEYCTGFDATCPSDVKREKGYVCNASRGLCEENATCDGTSGICPERMLKANRTQCKGPTGVCDLGSFCNGVSYTCPTSEKRPKGYVCNESSGPCETNGTCSGTSVTCSSKSIKSSSTTCRAAAGPCDVAEKCDGVHAYCPDDVKREKGYVCNASRGVCEKDGVCDGKTASCSVRALMANRTLCRNSTDGCDAGGYCNGVSYSCPTSEKRPKGYVCNASTGPCDEDSVCTGSSLSCPAKKYKPKTTLCRPAVGLCDYDEYCLGNASECPPNKFKPAGTECNRTYNCTIEDSAGSTEETTCNERFECTGNSGYCPFEEPVSSMNSLESANRVGFSFFSLAMVAVLSVMTLM